MSLILLLAMLQNVSVEIKPAPEFSIVSEDVIVQPKKSIYFGRTKARILAMKTPYKFNDLTKKYYISKDFNWYFQNFYFKGVVIPLSRQDEYDLRLLLIEISNKLEQKERLKKLEQL